MTIQLNPYLSFRDNAREAMEFYHSVFGGDLTISTFAEFQASQSPEEDNLVMHSALTVPGGISLMASDTPRRMAYTPGNDVSLSFNGNDAETLHRYWDGLSDGATITQPLVAAQWGDDFGMLTDKFGVAWLFSISAS